MPTIKFDVPEGALSALRLSPTEFAKEVRVAAALLWYSQGEISQSGAAVVGISRAEFIDGQIAAIAHVHGLVLATPNEKGFARFKGLTVENWSKRQVRQKTERT